MSSDLFIQIPAEVFEDVVLNFLDSKSLFSLLEVNHRLREFILSSSSVWENALRIMISNQEVNYKLQEKELKVGGVMRKLMDEFSDQIKEFKQNGIIGGILNYLNEEEFRIIYEEHYENLHYLIYCIFRAFSFDSSGFPKPVAKKNEEIDEVRRSIVDFTNDNHCFHSCHQKLRGDWESCIAHKRLLPGFRYFWAVHLTNLHKEGSNAWGILIGVDDLPNQQRNSDSHSLHYYIGNSVKHSNGKGYCVLSHSKLDGNCEYTPSTINKEGDVIGVEFFQEESVLHMKFYSQFGDTIVEYQYNIGKKVEFKPAVSIVSRMSVSILPWDGKVETLKKLL